MRRALPSLILLIAISLASLFFRLGSLPLSGSDEPRYARIAQEMHDHGNWVTPTLEGKPWLEKPPLYYWITIPFYSIFQSAETAARVGPAICALLAALSVFWLGSMIGSRLAGVFSATILLTSLGFAGFGRSASTDMPLTCCYTLAMAILALAVKKDIGAKVIIAYAFLGLAVLGKGPVALILAFGTGFCFWLLDERGVILRRWKVILGLVITAAVSFPWFWLAFKQNGYTFISTFFVNHNLARFVTDIHHHSQPFYFFLPVLLALFFPWSAWLLLLIAKSPLKGLRRWREWNPWTVFLACWFLVPMVFFSLSDSKLVGYVLPSLPPLALILGMRLSHWIEEAVEPPKLRAGMWIHLMLSVAMSVAAPMFFQRDFGGNWKVGLVLSFAILAPAVIAFVFKTKCRIAFIASALQGIVLLVAIVQFAFPVIGAYQSTREIAHQALRLRTAGEPIASYRFFQHSLHYYTGYQMAEDLDTQDALQRFVQSHPTSLIVTKSATLPEIAKREGISIMLLYIQGNIRLLRLTSK